MLKELKSPQKDSAAWCSLSDKLQMAEVYIHISISISISIFFISIYHFHLYSSSFHSTNFFPRTPWQLSARSGERWWTACAFS